MDYTKTRNSQYTKAPLTFFFVNPPCLVYSVQLEKVQCTLITEDWRGSFVPRIIQSLHCTHSERHLQLTIATGNIMCAQAILTFFIGFFPLPCLQSTPGEGAVYTNYWRMKDAGGFSAFSRYSTAHSNWSYSSTLNLLTDPV